MERETKSYSKRLNLWWDDDTKLMHQRYGWGEMSYKVLKEKLEMPNVEFHTYKGMGHSANNEELADLAKWLKTVIPAEASKI